MPKVTVLMSVYNGEPYLAEAIESILNQTFDDFEFLIVNDGSTDNTREIVLSIGDPKVRLVDNAENIGLTRSLNKGLRLAEGEYVARIDADDIAVPARLERQANYLDSHPDVALLGTWHTEVGADGNFVGEWELPNTWIQIRWALYFYTPFVHSSIMLRKAQVLDKVGYYNEQLSYSQDYELWSRIATELPSFSLSQRLVKTRVNPKSMTATYGEKALEGFRLRAATVSRMLRHDNARVNVQAERLNRMTIFLSGFGYNTNLRFDKLEAEDLSQVVEELISLQDTFCAYYGYGADECGTHRREVHSAIADRLLRVANARAGEDVGVARQALKLIAQLGSEHVLTKPYLKAACKSVLGLRASGLVQSWTP